MKKIGIALIIIAVVLGGYYLISQSGNNMLQEETMLFLDSNTTKISANDTVVTIKGVTDPNATVTINSEDFSLSTLHPKINENGEFIYEITIPKNLKMATFTVEAVVNGKNFKSLNFTMFRNEDDSNDLSGNDRKTITTKYIGNSKSMIFHLPGCEWAKKIGSWNLVKFSNRKEAINEGYDPCKVCNP
ncbi:MAG: hypothetical protein LBU40_00195 [Methanobrevibacter sp.]|jgi:hypothetical protein|nr:hypothetical protein [Methanobrevibacter sp.]